jgi:flagellar motor switch protein FliN/FliY
MDHADVQSILKLRVPVIVQLGQRSMTLREVMNLSPGSLIELPRDVDESLDLLVNNKAIGDGEAVKVGENFGLKVKQVGEPSERVKAMGPGQTE